MLNRSIKKSLSFSFFDKYVGYTLRFISTIIIARLCSPSDIGIFSVAFVLISIGHVLRDFGVAQYLIHEKEINSSKIRASLSLMWMIAWGLWAVLWLTKGMVAEFYGQPELEHAIEVLSLIYLLAPFGSVRIALLRREMDFKSLAKINIFSYLALHCVSVILAYEQWGFEALVWGQVAGVVATLLGTLLYSPSGCWFMPSLKGMKEVIRFGFPLCLSNVIETVTEGGADLVLGRMMSMQAVGIFGRAQGLLNLFKVAVISAVWPVVLPYFSIKNREEQNLLPDYLKAIEMYTMFAWPFFLGLALLAQPIVLILFGDQWIEAVPLLRVLSVVAMIQAVFPFNHALFVAKGEVNLNLKLQSCVSCFRVCGVVIGAFYSMMMVAYFLIVAEILAFLVLYWGLNRIFLLKVSDLYVSLKTNVFCFIMVFFVLFLVKSLSQKLVLSGVVELGLALSLSLGVWAGLLIVLKHPIYIHAQPILSLFKFRGATSE